MTKAETGGRILHSHTLDFNSEVIIYTAKSVQQFPGVLWANQSPRPKDDVYGLASHLLLLLLLLFQEVGGRGEEKYIRPPLLDNVEHVIGYMRGGR